MRTRETVTIAKKNWKARENRQLTSECGMKVKAWLIHCRKDGQFHSRCEGVSRHTFVIKILNTFVTS